MRKIIAILISFFIILTFIATQTFAEDITVTITPDPATIVNESREITFKFSTSTKDLFKANNVNYRLYVQPPSGPEAAFTSTKIDNETLQFTIPKDSVVRRQVGEVKYRLGYFVPGEAGLKQVFFSGKFTIKADGANENLELKTEHLKYQVNTSFPAYIINPTPGQDYTVWFDGDYGAQFMGTINANDITDNPGFGKSARINLFSGERKGPKKICFAKGKTLLWGFFGTRFLAGYECKDSHSLLIEVTTEPPPDTGQGTTTPDKGGPAVATPIPICQGDAANPDKTICNTGIGPIDVSSPEDFIRQLFIIVLFVAGIGTVGLLIFSGYIFMTSAGDKQKVQGAREQIVSAISGLLFIIFSIIILEVIGINILNIPLLGK